MTVTMQCLVRGANEDALAQLEEEKQEYMVVVHTQWHATNAP